MSMYVVRNITPTQINDQGFFVTKESALEEAKFLNQQEGFGIQFTPTFEVPIPILGHFDEIPNDYSIFVVEEIE